MSIGIVICLCTYHDAEALNGYTDVTTCNACYSLADFYQAAFSVANTVARPGSYVVVSNTYSRSAIVEVTGEPSQCQPFCTPHLLNEQGTAVDSFGTPITATDAGSQGATLVGIDGDLFGVSRDVKTPAKVTIDPDFASSIIGSDDEMVAPAINRALFVNFGIIANMKYDIGQLIKVFFKDGTSAVLIFTSKVSSIQWKWSGKAWNAHGRPINRSGVLLNNPNTAGQGSGTFQGGTSPVYELDARGLCAVGASAGDDDSSLPSVVVHADLVYIPC